MGFNTNPAELRRSIQRQDIEKRKLERPVAVNVRRLLRKMGADLDRVVAETGQGFNADLYSEDFARVLAVTYADTAKTFGVLLSDHISTHQDDDSVVLAVTAAGLAAGTSAGSVFRKFKKDVKDEFSDWMGPMVLERTQDITATSNKQITAAVNNALAASDSAEEPFSPKQLGKASQQNFLNSSLYHGDLIARTEVQNAAEWSKTIESSVFMGTVALAAMNTIVLENNKRWVTVGDDAVRPSHVAADYQEQPSDRPFLVGGYQLNQPGDGTQGAPMSEIANCRCQSNHIIDKA